MSDVDRRHERIMQDELYTRQRHILSTLDDYWQQIGLVWFTLCVVSGILVLHSAKIRILERRINECH